MPKQYPISNANDGSNAKEPYDSKYKQEIKMIAALKAGRRKLFKKPRKGQIETGNTNT